MVLEKIKEILEKCVRCGKCRARCPSLDASDEGTPRWEIYSPRGRMRLAEGLLEGKITPTRKLQDALYTCFVCNQCVEECPSMAGISDVIIETRRQLVKGGNAPEDVIQVQDTIIESSNIFDMEQEERVELWSMDVEGLVEGKINKPADLLYFVGCQASFRGNLARIPVRMVQILEKLDINYTLLGEQEECCGDPLELTGASKEEIKALASRNVDKIKNLGVKEVIFTCPGCYRMFKQVYPEILGRVLPFKMSMISEFLLAKIKTGDIDLSSIPAGRIVYHDPCELGRHMNMYDTPRELIKSIPGIDFVEFKENRENSVCCGMGGGVAMHDRHVSNLQARKKARAIDESEAEIVITHCPACFQGISNATMIIEKEDNSPVQVMDLVELIALAMGIKD